MQKFTQKVLFFTFLCSIILATGCANEDSNSQDPIEENQTSLEIKSLEVSKITETTATVSGNLVSIGDNGLSELGVCISTSPSPTVSGFKVNTTVTIGNFNCNLKDLSANTKYYVRAYAQSKLGITYSSETSFTTAKTVLAEPKVNTGSITSITPTSASINTVYENLDKIMIISAGIYISTSSNPSSVDINKTVLIDENYITKKYTVNISKLMPNTKYYVRSFVETIFGIYLGEIVSFTTKEATVPSITTGGVRSLSQSMAELDARVLSDSGGPITEYGFCWSNITLVPTLETDNTEKYVKTEVLKADYFEARINNLYPLGNYFYIRSFAKNKYGVGYGPVVKFKIN
ncbi:hypothetical protein [Flavobacterium sp. ASV13]|uniref:hypothetical protein n=1 Tax=Flavobacterium sp. ASV13 TaxID=1506583 RepID=UPI0005593BF7|nr:hypothetical protein [Flavobacterium sp. ASV13]